MTERQFPGTYSADIVDSIPPNVRLLSFGQSGTQAREPLLVAITRPDGESWVGAFARGHDERASETGIWSTPDDRQVAVVAAGAGYYVDIEKPGEWQEIPVFPIRIVLTLLQPQLLVFGDFARLAAYGSKGIKWTTSDFVWDDLAITSTDERSIIASGYDAEHDRRVEVRIDLESGEVVGAVRPPRRAGGPSADSSDAN